MFRQKWNALPQLIRFMLRHFANGVSLGGAFGLVLIWLDVGGLGSLLASFDNPLPTLVFFAKAGLLFGTLAMGVAVMNLGDDE